MEPTATRAVVDDRRIDEIRPWIYSLDDLEVKLHCEPSLNVSPYSPTYHSLSKHLAMVQNRSNVVVLEENPRT